MADYILVSGVRVAKNFTEETFGRLKTVGNLFWINISKNAVVVRRQFQVCVCDCGNHTICRKDTLQSGFTKSCGCLLTESAISASSFRKKHNESGKTTEYTTYACMKNRCLCESSIWYPYYGGRGIKICDRWLGESGFQNFLADMGRKPTIKHTLDRIDNNGNYCPDNCRWSTRQKQQRNRRNTLYIDYKGDRRCLAEWAEVLGVPYHWLYRRVRDGWTMEQCVVALSIDMR